jgi:hypothetical protein
MPTEDTSHLDNDSESQGCQRTTGTEYGHGTISLYICALQLSAIFPETQEIKVESPVSGMIILGFYRILLSVAQENCVLGYL